MSKWSRPKRKLDQLLDFSGLPYGPGEISDWTNHSMVQVRGHREEAAPH